MRALIVGAGVAGPVAAMALQQVGIEAAIFESHPPSDGELGSYFTLTANGLEGLAAIGARELATTRGFTTRRNVMWNETGRRLASLPLDSSVPGSPAAHTMKRSRLTRVLQDEAIRREIRIEYGRRLSTAEVAADGRVLATFDDGSTAFADLLIGADGVHSVVRRVIDPHAPEGRYVGLTNFGGVTRGSAKDIEPAAWHLIFGRQAFFGYQATPDGDVVWFANVPRPLITPEERASTSEDAWRRLLARLFAGDAGPAVELIEAGELELAADNTHDLAHVPVWHRGPMIIIGDAAHAPAPTSGQGASMAIEDAIALAGELGRSSSTEAAFAWGARGSSDKVPGRFGRIARDAMLRILFRWVITEKSLGWMYDYRIGLARPPRADVAEVRG